MVAASLPAACKSAMTLRLNSCRFMFLRRVVPVASIYHIMRGISLFLLAVIPICLTSTIPENKDPQGNTMDLGIVNVSVYSNHGACAPHVKEWDTWEGGFLAKIQVSEAKSKDWKVQFELDQTVDLLEVFEGQADLSAGQQFLVTAKDLEADLFAMVGKFPENDVTPRLKSIKINEEETIQCQEAGNPAETHLEAVNSGEDSVDSVDVDLSKKVEDVLLPTHMIPFKYKVQLVPFIIPDNYTIKGYTEIHMMCQESASNVTVHINNLNITQDLVSLKDHQGQDIQITGHKYDKEREFYIIELGHDLVPGTNYTMSVHFVAELADGLNGFYRSTYQNNDGEDVVLATTQFQAVDARRAFPCFDEPALKARFEISLGRIREHKSISNMPIKENGVAMSGTDDYVWDHYEESVPMSTYLVAFVVSDFDYEIAPPAGNDVTFRIWARSNALDQIAYAKSIGGPILKFFEDYFNVPYPLPKQDMIAIPDFGAGAMENWGLITYRETALLFKPGVSAVANKQGVAVMMSHELAHQWFGNLVTPAWWTDLWLNEGFATYMQYLAVDSVEPEMKILEQFVPSELHSAMRIDALATSHPISIPVNHPDEIAEIFDGISYAKGASIIRMMDHFLTTTTFRAGLTKYLTVMQYQAAEQDDLWRFMTEQAHEDNKLPKDVTIKTIMDTWTLQMGFPVINVQRDYADKSATINQERFLSGTNGPAEGDDHIYKWWVPVTFANAENKASFEDTYPKDWLRPDDESKKIPGMPNDNTAAVFNLNTDHTKIHVKNRAQIIDDAFNLARVGQLDYSIALGTTQYLSQETEYIPWKTALNGFGYIDTMLERTAGYGEFQRYMKTLVLSLFNRLGFESKPSDSPLDVYLRSYVVNWACSTGIQKCKSKTQVEFKRWMDQINPDEQGANLIDVNLKRQVYCYAIAQGGEEEWDFGWQRYLNSNVGSEKSSILNALSCSKELWILNRYLNMTLTPGSGIRAQDGESVVSNVASNILGRDISFDFIRKNWDKILEVYAGSSFAISSVLKSVLKDRNNEFDLNEIVEFQKDNEGRFSSGERSVRQAIEDGRNNLEWMKRHFETITTYLKAKNLEASS
eukprot:maker-scaffold1168_size57759-snap-gene-0.7 protein:Tk03865 transcript:maker-scaffold1168_size57759-snap-gene-0.7-mRNA-1 annotation:"aminopeptidase n"